MKKYFLLLSFVLMQFCCLGNAIDKLSSDGDVISFLNSNFMGYGDNLHFNSLQFTADIRLADSLGSVNWTTCDLDSNGETDLLIFNLSGFSDVTGILSEKGNYEKVESVKKIGTSGDGIEFATVKKSIGQNLILLFHRKNGIYFSTTKSTTNLNLFCDTLVFKFGSFINYVANPQRHAIHKIEFSVDCSQCDGDSLPNVTLSIDPETFQFTCIKKDFVKAKHTKWMHKSFTGTLTEDQVKKIISIISYSNFPDLKNNYILNYNAQPANIITIYYDDGKTKTINDYGQCGTYTLMEIYKITSSISWTEVK